MPSSLARSITLLSLLILSILALPVRVQATPPPAPTNFRSILTPAEIILSWDPSPGATSYRVIHSDASRRWVPLGFTTETRIRDHDFPSLPCLFQVVAYNETGEFTASAEFTVSNQPAAPDWYGVNPRPISDTSFALVWNMPVPGDALVELGTSLNNYDTFLSNPTFATRQEFIFNNLQPETTYYYRITSGTSVGGGQVYSGTFATRPFTEPAPVSVSISADGSPITIATDEDTPLSITLTTDNPEGAPLTYSVVQSPYSGSLVGTPPDLVFIPAPESGNPDQFQVTVTDGIQTRIATVIVDVHSIHDSPIAHDRSVSLNEDSGIKFLVTSSSFDADPSTFRYFVVSGPTNGVLTHDVWFLAPNEFQYLPNTNFHGIDHFTFVASDGQTTGNVATVRIQVDSVLDAPLAFNQAVTISRNGQPVAIPLNYSDADGDALSVSLLTLPRWGTADIRPMGIITYTPRAPYTNNTDSFRYQVSDGFFTASATVTITVTPPYSLPVANSFSATTESNQLLTITLSGIGFDGAVLSNIWLIQGPAFGSLSGTAPNYVYAPNGSIGQDRIVYRVIDSLGIPSADAVVTINIVAPSAPVAPSGLTATAVSSTQIDLMWTDNAQNEDSFRIERSNDNRSWKVIATVGPNVQSFSNTGLKHDKTFFYRVRAVNRVGASGYSNTASAKTLK